MALAPIEADLSGKVAVVTGANSGIGRQIAENLSSLGADVVMACRSRERGEAALQDIASRGGSGRLDLLLLDQARQGSIRQFAVEFTERYSRLDILVNNACIYPGSRELSEDGIELCWATNVMGYFLLTLQLQELLVASAPARVVFVASELAGEFDMDDLQWQRRRFGGIKAYKQSKAANRMLTYVFAERLAGTGVTANVVHPGGVNTGIGRNQKGLWGVLVRLAFKTQRPVSAGADTTTWLAASPEALGETGGFWADRSKRDCEFRDLAVCRELWQRCEEMVVSEPP